MLWTLPDDLKIPVHHVRMVMGDMSSTTSKQTKYQIYY